MTESFDLILKNGTVVTPAGAVAADVGVTGGKIVALGRFDRAAEVIDCAHLHILPGVIDAHVHFREPGLTHKEDISTGTLAAVFGGVTAVMEMPNTDPLTLTGRDLADKLLRAHGRAWCDHAFYIGGCAGNAARLGSLEQLAGCAGVKVFMGSSTGDLLAAEEEVLAEIFRHGTRRLALHAEDEARLVERRPLAKTVADHPLWRDETVALTAVRRAVALARKYRRNLHFLHVTSGDEIAFLKDHRDIATIEVTPQHLTFAAPECYASMGTRAQMNPPIRDAAHRDALWRAVTAGLVDVIGSDHAPHTLEEKAKDYPAAPSGMPGVETLLPVMLTHVAAGRLSLPRLADLVAHRPASLHGLSSKGMIEAGRDADFAIVDTRATWRATDRAMHSRCGWTPYDGMRLTGRVTGTVLRGQVCVWEGEAVGMPRGRPLSFDGVAGYATIGDERAVLPPAHTCCQ